MNKYVEQLGSKLLRAGQPAYETARRAAVWRANKPQRYPEAIVLAESEQDVIAAVRLARTEGLQVACKAGGHLWTSPWLRDGSLLIDTSRLQQIRIDPQTRTVWAGPGTTGMKLHRALRPYDLMATTGHHPTVALGGFLICGGFGWNSRQWGTGCANVLAIDVVTADGEFIRADATQNQDYYWAARGSGPGFFGAVTRFLLRVYPAPKVIRHSSYDYELEQLEDVLTWSMQIGPSVPMEVELLVTASSSDNFGRWAPTRVSVSALAIGRSDQEAHAGLAFMDSCPVINKAQKRRMAMPTTLDERFESATNTDPAGCRYACDNIWTNAPPEQVVPLARELFSTLPTPRTHVLWQPWYPCAPLPDMAFSLQANLYVAVYTVWDDPKNDSAMERWPIDQMRRFAPISCGGEMNDENISHRAQPYLSAAASARWEELRAKYDPENVFVSFMKSA